MGKVKRSDIRPELRPAATLLNIRYRAHDEDGFAAMDKRSGRKQGKWSSRLIRAEEAGVVRPDGSVLRLLICSAVGGTQPQATGLLWMHGGGFAYGVPEDDALFAERFCEDGSCVAVMPDYTKSTQSPYPSAFEDCRLALFWMKDHAAEIGISANQLFVGGTGAGGGLAAALCIAARERGDINIAYQILISPMLDDRMVTASSQDNNAPVWDSRKNRAAWDLYLKTLKEEDMPVPAFAAPARERRLSDLPPACSYVGELDPLRDETVRYIARLKKSGVKVSLRVFGGCYHNFEQTAVGSRIAASARRFLMENFRYAQQNCRAQNGASMAEW
ncbi:MAG: alpha/beta hydrolase fold domain-containing protein [Lachnospiraceae bacterium]|nr:alpha/beta hydrolase fold domain-containing protein [Lachnospiraceae bacterium]